MSESNYGKRKISDMHDWYFDGYEPVEYVDDNGRKRTKLVYDGTWYSFGLDEAGLRKMRRTFLLIMIPYVLINVLGLLHMCSLAAVLPGGLFAINLVPVFYFCVGLVHLLRLPPVFNNRQRCRSMRRMEAGVWCMIAIVGLDVLISAINLIFKDEHTLTLGNIIFVLMSVALLVANIWLRRLVDRYRYKVVSDKRSRKKEKEMAERIAAAKAEGKTAPAPVKEKKAPLPGAIDAIIEVEEEELEDEFDEELEEELEDEE